MEFKPVRFQAAFFLGAIDFSAKIEIASMIRKKAKAYFDLDPIIFPWPQGTPQEIPQIIIQNGVKGCELTLSSSRLDIIILIKPEDTRTTFEIIEEIQTISKNIYRGLINNFDAKVNRLGFISTLSTNIENAPEILISKYLKTDVSSHSEEIHFLFLHKIEFESFKLNKWTRLVSTVNPSRLSLEVDINTQTEYPIIVTVETVEKFWANSNKLLKETITLHQR
jgi:hypothetical protein